MRFRAFISCSLAVLCQLALVLPRTAFALEPPRPGEVEQLQQTGEWKGRLARARALGNHRIDQGLLERAIYKARREALRQRGINPDEILPAPPEGWGWMPTTGNVKIFALLIDFLDYPAYSTQSAVHSALFGDGSGIPTNSFPYESLNSFYERSSYNQLHLSSGMTLGWYHAPYNRSSVPETTEGREALIKEAIASFDGAVDFSQFNNDTSDNVIEYFIVIWTGPNNGWANFWWGYQTGWLDSSYTVDAVRLYAYSWQWEGSYGSYGPFDPSTVIHETGHGLGLPDYYDYDDSVGPDGGVGGLDVMDGNWGDHNSFSKWLLEWITPAVVAAGSQTLTLDPSGTSQDAVLIMPGATSTDAFREFFIAQNRYRVGNDPNYPTDGMLIWHVDARLNAAGYGYAYNNSYTAHKLLKLMQADGLDRIENESATADAAMYYNPGKSLGPLTAPSSWTYQGVDTGANVTGISQSWPQMTATFSIDDPRLLPTLTVTKAGNGSGAVTSTDGGISLGSDGQQSYAPGTVVTLNAVPAPGCAFADWSGGGSGGGVRTVTMSADTTVTATFTTTLLLDEDFDPESPDPPAGWYFVNPLGASWWWFDSEYNTSGGDGACALGAQYDSSPAYDSELQTPAMDLSAYAAASLGLEFKTSIESCSETADVDVSVNGSSGPWTNVWTSTTNLCGPQTVNIDLTSTAAGYSNVVLRFRHYGTGLWWVIDDVKIMAAAPAGVPVPNVVLELHPNERAPGMNTPWILGGAPWTQPMAGPPQGSYWWKKYEFAAHGPLWIQVCAENWDKTQKGYLDHDDTKLQVNGVAPTDYDGIQSGTGSWQWTGGAESGKRVTLRFLVPCTPGKQTLWVGADESPALWWLKVIDLEPEAVEPL